MNPSADTPDAAADAPLAGLRVLDLTRVLAGPYCTMILADLGAEVVKIERPDVGDDARHFGPFLPSGLSAYFASINRGKKSVVLDLRDDAHRQTFLQLVAVADVLVENFRPGTMDAFGLAPRQLQALNPNLVYASASGFGRAGSMGSRPAYDVIVQALSGLMSITGSESGEPVRVGTSISDILTGMFTAIGILAALQARDRTGRGADLDLAMLDCTVAALENAISRFEVTGEVPRPLGTRHPSIAPFQAYQAADGPLVVAAGNDSLWRKLCEVIEAPELVADPRLATNALRSANLDALEAELNRRFASHAVPYWLTRLEQAGVPCAPVRNIADVVTDQHLHERGMFHRMQTPGDAPLVTAGSPLRFNGHPPRLSPCVPKLGEHTQEVLREWLDHK